MPKKIKYLALGLIILVILGCTIISLNNNSTMQHTNSSAMLLPIEGELPSLSNATGWLNTKQLSSADLRGRVVLINFCTYSCINWLRTLPYIRSWATKYHKNGLVVIGVHTPEFPFEESGDNVRHAIEKMKINYPIALDNNYSIWSAFDNQYWPALYCIDAEGHIRHHQFGEGGYEESEKIIQQLLAEAGSKNISKDLVTANAEGIEAAADWRNLQSNENYLGYGRTQNFSSPGGVRWHKNTAYTAPAKLALNAWALEGDWIMRKGFIVSNKTGGRILYCFHARDLHLVMGPGITGSSVKFRVLIDGQPPKANHGNDIDEEGYGVVSEHRLYQLLRQPGSIVDRQFEIQFFDSGVEVFSFTFG
jgi:hypothetical protein